MYNKNIGVVAVCLVSLIIRTSATSYTVGDDFGWSTPTSDPSIFTTWAAHKIFNVGDILVFDYRAGHTVTEVTKADFESCTATHPISSVTAGPVSVTLKTAGEHFYICTLPGHCRFGQKVAINVAPSSAIAPTLGGIVTAPSPTTSASPFATPPTADAATVAPPPAKSDGVAGFTSRFVLPLLLLVAVFLFIAGNA